MKGKFLLLSILLLAVSFVSAGEFDKNELLYQNPILGHYLSVEEIGHSEQQGFL